MTMGLSISPYQLKSVSLRTNEEFARLYNQTTKARCLEVQRNRKRICNVDGYWPFPRGLIEAVADQQWASFQYRIRHVDKLMKRAEKNAEFSKLLAGNILQFQQDILPALREFRYNLQREPYSAFDPGSEIRMLDHGSLLQELLEVFADCLWTGLESAHKVVVSALALLSFVYRCLIGCVDKGGSKTYSPGSFLFRLIFVAIVLFLGSYVWIKSRQASYTANRRKRKSYPFADRTSQLGDESDVPGGVYRRAVKDPKGSVTHCKYEPRFKPRREKLESGTTLKFNYLPLGSYATPGEAEIVRHIAAVLYGKEECHPVQFEDGLCLPFPSVTEGENCPPSGKEKAVWVTHKTKELYAELLEEKARRFQLLHRARETGSHHGHVGEASRRDPSRSAPGAPSSAIELTSFTSPHGGDGVEERATSNSHGLGQEALLAREVFSAFYPDPDFDQVIRSIPQWEENEFPALDDLGKVVGEYTEADCIESPLVPPQSSALDISTTAIVASLSPLGDQDLEILEPHLNSGTAITFQQLESLPEQVQLQQRATCQEKCPKEFAGSNVELQQKLLESEVRNSELQQKLRKSEVENEKWRSMFRQLAKLI